MTGAGLRRLMHIASAGLLLAVPVMSWRGFQTLLTAVAAAWLMAELVRIRVPAVHRWITGHVPVFREAEARRVSGSGWLVLGYAMATWFTPSAGTAGILVGATADPAASLAGGRFSTSERKSLVGSATCLLAAGGALTVLHLPWPAVAAGAVAAALLERWPAGLNDNLIVAPGVAAVVWAFA